MAGVKLLHELGHALACKCCGAECHEMGVLLLCFMPCLYCNVSDAWMLPNKWHRAAIASAGIYIEIVLASLATFVWWWAQPGLLSHLCLSTMLVCSVNSVLLNGNPLLRYDGYFVLSSLTEVPNLAPKASALLVEMLNRLCLGIDTGRRRLLIPQQSAGWMLAYSIASLAYRLVVLFTVAWAFHAFFEMQDLQVAGRAVVVVLLAGVTLLPMARLIGFLRVPGRLAGWKPRRAWISLTVCGLFAAGLFGVPLPRTILAPLTLEARSAARVYVTSPGTLDRLEVQPGTKVSRGAVAGGTDQPRGRAEYRRPGGPGRRTTFAVAELAPAANDRRQRLGPDPRHGPGTCRLGRTAKSAARRTAATDPAGAVRWSGASAAAPLSVPWPARRVEALVRHAARARNLGCFLENETLLCLVGDIRRLEALLVIDQGDIEFVSPAQRVEIQFDMLPGRTFSGTLAEVAEIDLETAPQQLSHKLGGDLVTRSNVRGEERPESTSYQARVPLDDVDGLLVLEARGRAKIHVALQTLAERSGRLLRQTFVVRAN